ncbi:antitoxin Xre/MbcA/ParS toxin-binding domain-containing protein [Pseudomonas sp. S2_H01]
MIKSLLQELAPKTSACLPTECLLHNRADQFSLAMIYRRIMEGFSTKDMRALLGGCVLESTTRTMLRGLGMSTRAYQRHRNDKGDVRLTALQSALAYQYAQVLERSTRVFGTQTFAEEWLGQPCKFLDGNVPLSMVENVIGAQAVEEYLKRIEYGVYQ